MLTLAVSILLVSLEPISLAHRTWAHGLIGLEIKWMRVPSKREESRPTLRLTIKTIRRCLAGVSTERNTLSGEEQRLHFQPRAWKLVRRQILALRAFGWGESSGFVTIHFTVVGEKGDWIMLCHVFLFYENQRHFRIGCLVSWNDSKVPSKSKFCDAIWNSILLSRWPYIAHFLTVSLAFLGVLKWVCHVCSKYSLPATGMEVPAYPHLVPKNLLEKHFVMMLILCVIVHQGVSPPKILKAASPKQSWEECIV